MTDMVNSPPHYNSSKASCSGCGKRIEAIDVIRHMEYDIGTAMKYLWRQGLKSNAVEDLEKAIWYIRDAIKELEKEWMKNHEPKEN